MKGGYGGIMGLIPNSGILLDIMIIKIALHFSIVTIASLVYRGSTGIPLSPIRRFMSNIVIATVIAYSLGEMLIPRMNKQIYVVSFFVGLCSDTIVIHLLSKHFQFKMLMAGLQWLAGLFNQQAKEAILSYNKQQEQGKEKLEVNNNEKAAAEATTNDLTVEDTTKRRIQRPRQNNRR